MTEKEVLAPSAAVQFCHRSHAVVKKPEAMMGKEKAKEKPQRGSMQEKRDFCFCPFPLGFCDVFFAWLKAT